MKSSELIKGKWYVCSQHPSPIPSFKFDKIKSHKCFYSESKNRDGYKVKKGFIIAYYYYDFYEVETPSEALKPTLKRKRYEKKRVEELLEKLANDIFQTMVSSITPLNRFTSIEQWKQDNL